MPVGALTIYAAAVRGESWPPPPARCEATSCDKSPALTEAPRIMTAVCPVHASRLIMPQSSSMIDCSLRYVSLGSVAFPPIAAHIVL